MCLQGEMCQAGLLALTGAPIVIIWPLWEPEGTWLLNSKIKTRTRTLSCDKSLPKHCKMTNENYQKSFTLLCEAFSELTLFRLKLSRRAKPIWYFIFFMCFAFKTHIMQPFQIGRSNGRPKCPKRRRGWQIRTLFRIVLSMTKFRMN